MLTIKLEKDEVSPHLRKLLKSAATNGPLRNVLGRAGANELKKHFRARNATPNALGGKRTNFWSAVALSVQAPRQTGAGIVIPVSHPAIAQKVHGGTISATRAKNLAIPIHARAHGRSPRVFTGLQYARTRAGTQLLGLREDGGMVWLYVLKKSVSQSKDPAALPPSGAMAEALTRAARIHLRAR
jgi:hypothetical protein